VAVQQSILSSTGASNSSDNFTDGETDFGATKYDSLKDNKLSMIPTAGAVLALGLASQRHLPWRMLRARGN
jgi:hypothetical protein